MCAKNDEKTLSKPNLDLLFELYRYRSLSTRQVMEVGKLGEWYVYKKLNQLREKGYILTNRVKGNYIVGQSRQGNYHRLSHKGIKKLEKHGYPVESSADDIRVSDYRLPYLLVGNELCICLEQHGWKFSDSRTIKSLKQLNKRDLLHGMLVNPENNKEYAVYVFLQTVQPDSLARVKREVMRTRFENILIVTRGFESFEAIMESFTDKKETVIKGGSVKVMPFQFAKSYLTISDDNRKNHEYFLENIGLKILDVRSNKNDFGTNVMFEYLVEHNGEEMYFVDLLDNDLMKLQLISEYRKEEYMRNGRKVLVLTSNSGFHYKFHKELLSHIQHLEFLPINAKQTIKFANSLLNKNVFGKG